MIDVGVNKYHLRILRSRQLAVLHARPPCEGFARPARSDDLAREEDVVSVLGVAVDSEPTEERAPIVAGELEVEVSIFTDSM